MLSTTQFIIVDFQRPAKRASCNAEPDYPDWATFPKLTV